MRLFAFLLYTFLFAATIASNFAFFMNSLNYWRLALIFILTERLMPATV